jgi:hypothetical protein
LGLLDQATGFAPDEGGVELDALRASLEAFRAHRYGTAEQADATFDGLASAAAALGDGHPMRSLVQGLIGATARMPAGCFGGRRRSGSPLATPDNVLTVLPGRASAGASVLHLGAHAHLATPPVDFYLALDGESRLRVRDMLEQTRHRAPDGTGGLVVLGACASDHSGREHDEALTLATAFLAAGAVGVVGARWGVEDIPTAIFMIVFHHYLNSGYDDPATALRAAQVWMLNKERRLPAGVDPLLVAELSRIELTVIDRWAAFTYQGR